MGIAEQLSALRRDFPQCRLATFADLSSGLALFTSADARLPQERLDALLRRAKALFDGETGELAAGLLGTPVRQVALSDGDGLLVLVRSAEEPDEAMICHCENDVDLAAFMARAALVQAALGSAT